MTPREFSDRYLPESYSEYDLQMLVQRRIKKWGLINCPAEVNIKCHSGSVRRSDLETWCTRYELKRELTYDNLYKCLGQLAVYNHYGSKILGFIPKKRCIIGISPSDDREFQSAIKLAVDIEKMGIQVVFIDKYPKWKESSLSKKHVEWIVCSIVFLTTFAVALLLSTR